ncbi:unnamed protein product [Arabis nemorensis]|uniref:RRM domain-containing protein n=1 Tax=Arabis nemorensis TaxID=586526 RepID=A0A565C5N1_9BRAS|nr:unnamed protein product [Arabis nemorensis]
MAEGVSTLTFPMSRESESASRLKSIITDMLPLFSDDYYGDVLSEYITVLVCNGKSQKQAREDLDAFLGKQSCEFVACLWELLLKDFSLDKRETSAPEPKTVVDCGSYDTPVEQSLISRRHNDQKATKATYCMNEKLISATAPIEDIEAHVSPKVRNMKMLRRELMNSPCKRAPSKRKVDWNSSGLNYSRKVLRSIVVSANKQPCGTNSDKYEKCMDERSGILHNRPYLSERETRKRNSQSVPSGGAVSARSHDAASHQEMKPHVSVWDRLARPWSSRLLDRKCHRVPKFGSEADEKKVLQQHGPAFPAAYIEREVPAVGYIHRSKSHKARQAKSGTITSTEPRMACNLSRKRRYGNPNSGDSPVCEFSSVLQSKQAKQDVENPSLLSNQSAKPDLFSEIRNVKQKLQQLEIQIFQAKQLKQQKIGELKCSSQSGKLQQQQDIAESRIIHVTNVHYAASKEAISMLFSKCGAVKNVTIVTNPVTRQPKGSAFVTFATNEAVNKAIALNNTMFYSSPIKVQRHVISSGIMSETPATQVVT